MSKKKASTKRARVNADTREDQAKGLGANVDPRDPNAETRPPRVQMGRGGNLTFSEAEMDKEKFHYYAFYDNPDRPGRIEQAKAAYWEHVTNREGQPITRPAGGGLHYLMRLPIKYWLEDLMVKKEKIRARMVGETKVGKGEYAPTADGHREGGDSMRTTHTSDNPYS